MSGNPDTRQTVLSTGDSIFQLIEELTKNALNSKEVCEIISSQSKEKLNQTINQIIVNSFEPRNATLISEGASPIYITSIAQNSSEVLQKISEKAIDDLIRKIPDHYTKLLDDKTEESYNNLLEDLLTKTQEKLSEFTKDSLNDILKKIENRYLTISIEDFKTNVKKTKITINMIVKISIKPINPYVQVMFEGNGIQKQLCKITFQTDGTMDFVDILLVAHKKKLEINLGKLDAKFRVSLKNLEALDRTIMAPKEDQDVVRELITVDVKKQFSTATLKQKE